MAAGGKIADFFAKVGFKVDAKELQKIDKHFLALERRFERTANRISRSSDKISKSFDKIINKSSKARQAKSVASASEKMQKSQGVFSATQFMSKESNIRNMLGLSEKDNAVIQRYMRRIERLNISQAQSNALIKEAIAKRKRQARELARITKKTQELSFVQSKLVASTKQFVGGFVGAFAAIQGFQAVKKTGQELEGARYSMLAASKDSMDLQKSLAFVDKQAVRLGLDLVGSTKAFVKLKAVSKDLKDEDLQSIFLGVAEAGTVLQLSQDDMKGALKAKICMAY